MSALMLVVAAAAAVAALAGAQAGLQVGAAPCGQTECPPHTFCSPYDHSCQPCEHICDEESNNYGRNDCEKHCQGYLHDVLYVPRNIMEQLSRQVRSQAAVAWAALGVSVLVLLAAAAFAAYALRGQRHLLWRFTKRGASRAHSAHKQKVGAGADDPEAGRKATAAGLQLPVAAGPQPEAPPTPSPVALSRSVSRDVATPATTSTPLSRPRHPSEDTTLEYAYDNPALTPSPGPGAVPGGPVPAVGGRKESSF